MDRFIPLVELADNFYHTQHEIGYLQAGALVEYLVQTYGWAAFSEFYRNIDPQGEQQSQAIDVALQEYFGISLAELETQFIAALRQQPLTPENAQDVALTVAYYDTLRRYQQILDPSAYFLTAWLPSGPGMREQGIVADYLRHYDRPENLALELLLGATGAHLRDGAYQQASETIQAASVALDALKSGYSDPFSRAPLAQAYWEIVLVLQFQGYQPQTLIFRDGIGHAQVRLEDTKLYNLTLENSPGSWSLVGSSE